MVGGGGGGGGGKGGGGGRVKGEREREVGGKEGMGRWY